MFIAENLENTKKYEEKLSVVTNNNNTLKIYPAMSFTSMLEGGKKSTPNQFGNHFKKTQRS